MYENSNDSTKERRDLIETFQSAAFSLYHPYHHEPDGKANFCQQFNSIYKEVKKFSKLRAKTEKKCNKTTDIQSDLDLT